MITAIPARKPVMMGADSSSAIHPSRASHTSATSAPTITARIPTRSWYPRVPLAAKLATPTANRGAIVESAPTDMRGLEPSSANRTVPATKA